MDEIRRPRPRSASQQRPLTAPARPSPGGPKAVWNSTTRQWWIPPTAKPAEAIVPPSIVPKPVVPAPTKDQAKPTSRYAHTTASAAAQTTPPKPSVTITIRSPRQQLARLRRRYLGLRRWQRYSFSAISLALIFAIVLQVVLPFLDHRWQSSAYALTPNETSIISKTDAGAAQNLKYDPSGQAFNFSSSTASHLDGGNSVSAGGQQIKATLPSDLSKGVTVTDPGTQADLTITPKFTTLRGQQQKNQVLYPINGNGTLVYTAQAIGVKEDILIKQQMGDTLHFKYTLGLGSKYEARILSDGSLGIYGSSSPITGATASAAKDQALLKKAQERAIKDKLIFALPAPTIKGVGDTKMTRAAYSIKGSDLMVTASHLKHAGYPLSIDPTVQIATTNEFYRNTSIESNADFDVANNKITRGALTGGTTATWAATTNLNQARFLAGATAFNGYAYVVGGVAGSTTTNLAGSNANMVEYAPITATTPTFSGSTYLSPAGTISNPSVLGTWAAGNNSGLPAGGLSRFQLIGYKGFIYAIGGSGTDSTCASGTLSTVVYYASVQVNGVLSNWQTTNAPTVARCSLGATAYNGKIYVAGGKTNTAATGTASADVSVATVSPNGTLTWNSGVSPSLPTATYGGDLQAYNGYLYYLGGNSGTALSKSVYYVSLNASGLPYGSWTQTNSFVASPAESPTALTAERENFGATFSTIKNGYIYIAGGCTVVNASQTCATQQYDVQLAQLNADGSLGQWARTTDLVSSANRSGANLVAWRGTLYSLGGCATMSTITISCPTTLATTQYGTITPPGQASTLTKLTSTSSPDNRYPAASNGGIFGASAAVLNGFLYSVGGCIVNGCSTNVSTTNQTYYAQINADGTLGAWQNVAAAVINGAGTPGTTTNIGIAETALVAANGTLYAFGGYASNLLTSDKNTVWSITPNATTGAPPAVAWTALSGALDNAAHAMSVIYFNGYFVTFGGCATSIANSFGCSSYFQNVTRYTATPTALARSATLTALPTTAAFVGGTTTTAAPNAAMGLAFYNNYVYLCGGASQAQGQTQVCLYTNFTNTATPTLGSWSGMSALLNYNDNVSSANNHPLRRGAAYAANGYLYVYSGHDGVGSGTSLGTINIGKLGSNGNIASQSDMIISTTSFTPKWDTATAFANGNIYTVGGCNAGNPPAGCTARSNLTEYFQIYNATNSATRTQTTTTALTSGVTGASATVNDGYLYIVGGCGTYSGTNCGSTATSTSQYAAINPDGSLPATFASGPALPQGRGFGCLVAQGDSLYYMGGFNNGPPQNNVYVNVLTAGVPAGTWGTGTVLLNSIGGISCATYNNRIYVTGGQTTNSANSVTATSYYTTTSPNGGTTISWGTLGNSFATARSYHATVAVAGYLYVLGGYDGSNTLSDVQFAQINTSTGDVGTWAYTNDLPYKMRAASAFAANGYIYVVGGSTGASTGCLNTTYVANVASSGNLGYWTQGVASTFSARFGTGAAYYNGYYYVIGGADCSGTPVMQTTNYIGGEQSQAIRSIFTRYIDFVGDATPQKFVINGGNAQVNAIDIEKWRMTYSSSRQATNAFGISTINTSLPFGPNPFVITAIDGSSVNQGVGRYWSITFDLDQTQSFAFIDSTQPAITAYSFYYSPSGNTRLRNGRIFQDQSKQALDAHP
jgi:hypothetical protein